MNLRLPWKIRVYTYRGYQYGKALATRPRFRKQQRPSISFLCRYHQITGSSIAIAGIANQLAEKYAVDAYVEPLSGYSRHLSTKIVQRFSPSKLAGEIYVIDIEQRNRTVVRLLAQGKQTVLTCHALPTVLHAVSPERLRRNFELTNHIHFVSRHQQSRFVNYYPDLPIRQKSFVIPNYSRKSVKTSVTGNIGIVGHLNRKPKNARQAVHLAHCTRAKRIHCWGSEEIAGLEDASDLPRLKINGWSNSLQRIHKSFDVLVSLSRYETFGLVVAEALSAGIPCFLSDIPVFKELYADCPGVRFQSGDERHDVNTLNQLLNQAQSLKPDIIDFWTKNFSENAVRNAWYSLIDSERLSPKRHRHSGCGAK